jgi:hypothetical protein
MSEILFLQELTSPGHAADQINLMSSSAVPLHLGVLLPNNKFSSNSAERLRVSHPLHRYPVIRLFIISPLFLTERPVTCEAEEG